MEFFDNIAIKTFDLIDLVGRTLIIKSFKDSENELIIAFDNKSGETFVLKSILHSCESIGKATL